MPITSAQAFDLAQAYLDLAHAHGRDRFAHWDDLTPAQRHDVEDDEWRLLNLSTDLTPEAVGIALDDVAGDVKVLQDATGQARDVVTGIQRTADVLRLAAAVALGGALVARHPGAILTAAKDLLHTARTVH